MIPLPDPTRLFPRKWMSPRETGHRSSSLAEGLLALGGIPILLAVTFGGGALAGKLSPWLCIPGGLLALVLGITACEAPPILLGIFEALFYSGVTFVFSGGLDRRDPTPSWIGAGCVAAVFLSATLSRRTNRDA
jgi:hypothetical protein